MYSCLDNHRQEKLDMARGRKSALIVTLSNEQREELEGLRRKTTARAGVVKRARIVLLREEGSSLADIGRTVGVQRRIVRKWIVRYLEHGLSGLADLPRPGRPPVFPPQVAVHLVKMACERPEQFKRSLSRWDCTELARELVRAGVVDSISASTVRRILKHHKLKPWRHHLWMSPKTPRDLEFYRRVQNVIDIYTCELFSDEIVYSLDEKTSLQPRPRVNRTLPAKPSKPNRVEHEYRRAGALNLFAASIRAPARCSGVLRPQTPN